MSKTEKHLDYYPNGEKFREYTSKDGKEIEKTLWTYYENGQKSSESTFKKDGNEISYKKWHENGQKKSEETWKYGRLLSSIKMWDEDGMELFQNTDGEWC